MSTVLSRHEVDVEDIEYLRHGSKALLARLYKPRGSGPFPLVIDLHGGAWCRGDRLNDAGFNEHMARHGIAVAALDFRMPPDASYPGSMTDINYGIRWFKARAADMRSRPDRMGIIGASSGGHQAMLAAMRPRDARYAALPLPGGAATDATVRCAVLCWPVIDPLGRYNYAKKLKAGGKPYPDVIDRVLPDHDKYWLTEDNMAEGSPTIALERGERVETPPVLYLQGARDAAHPRPDLDRFVAAYRKAGGRLDLRLYEGEGEGFMTKNPQAPSATDALERIVEFVHEETR